MSGRKNNLKQFNSIGAPAGVSGDMTTSITSLVTDVQFLDDLAYQFTWSGAPVGNFQIQVSANHSEDFVGNVLVAGNWVPLTVTYWNGTVFVTGTTIPTTVGSPIYVDLTLMSTPYLRAVYTAISGSGSLTATVTGKQI